MSRKQCVGILFTITFPQATKMMTNPQQHSPPQSTYTRRDRTRGTDARPSSDPTSHIRSDARDSTDHFHTDKADMRTHTHITHAHDHGASRVCSAHERGHDTHDLTTRDTTYAERDPRTTLRAPLTPTRGVPHENTVTECTQMRGTPTHTTCLSPRPEATTARHGQHHHHHTPT